MAIDTWLSPGQTVVVGPPRRDLGGKGANQALVLSRTGAPVRFVAAVGMDAEGDWVAERLAREGLSDADLLRTNTATDRSLIFVNSDGENAIASTTAAACRISPDDARSVIDSLNPGDGLLMQGNLTFEATRAALGEAKQRGVRTIFNPSPMQQGFADLLGHVDLLVLNEGEAATLGGKGSPRERAESLRQAGARIVVLTLGGQGALLVDQLGFEQVPALRVQAIDTTGAGDTFTGVLVGALFHHGLSRRASVEAASAAAALVVQRQGTMSAFPSREEIAAILPV